MKKGEWVNGDISVMYRYGRQYFVERLEERGCRLRMGQMPSLLEIWEHPGITQEGICQRVGMDKGTTARAVKSLEEDGLVIRTADPRDRKLIYKIPPETIFEFAVAHTDPRADTLFLSCTGMRALEIIRDLEERLSIPVVTSNQTAIWLMGSYFGRHSDHAMEYLGRLFTLPCPL